MNNSTEIPKTALILAGGLGTRLRSVVSDRPKPMAIINQKPFLDWLVRYWHSKGVTKFVFSIGYMADTIKNYFESLDLDCSFDFCVEEKPLGTGGALISSLTQIEVHGPILLLNGDSFLELDIEKFSQFSHETSSSVTLALFESNNSKRYMPVELKDNFQISSFTAVNIHQNNPFLVNGGVYFLSEKQVKVFQKMKLKKCSFERTLLPNLLRENVNVFGFKAGPLFIDIGVPEDYKRAKSFSALGFLENVNAS